MGREGVIVEWGGVVGCEGMSVEERGGWEMRSGVGEGVSNEGNEAMKEGVCGRMERNKLIKAMRAMTPKTEKK
jgi:hypothetical protein